MNYTIAGIDIHKKVLMVVVTEVTVEEFEFTSRRCGTSAQERKHLVAWLQERGVQEIVMESTAQYWEAGVDGAGAAFWPTALGASALQPRAERAQA